VRDLKTNLSRHLDDVAHGTVLTVTDRGVPVAVILPVGDEDRRLRALVEQSSVRPPTSPERHTPRRVVARGAVSDLVDDQRR
jgi:prevent-host-death family protein